MGLWEVGPHCVGEEAEVARLGWVFRVHEDVTVLVVSVAGRGVDAGKFLGSWLSCNEDRFYLLVCLTPPAIAWKLFALSFRQEIRIVSLYQTFLNADWQIVVASRAWSECVRDMTKLAQ